MQPMIDNDAKIGKGAIVVGDVVLSEGVSVWYHAVLRGDCGKIIVGKNTNIQEHVMIHQHQNGTTVLGEGITVGHGAILHGCTIGDNTLIGMGSIILDDAVIGKNCVIGAGSLITGKKQIEDGSLVFGNPAKVIRPLTKEEIEGNIHSMKEYLVSRDTMLVEEK